MFSWHSNSLLQAEHMGAQQTKQEPSTPEADSPTTTSQRPSIQSRRQKQHKLSISTAAPQPQPTLLSPSVNTNMAAIAQGLNTSLLPRWLYRILRSPSTIQRLFNEIQQAEAHRLTRLEHLFSTTISQWDNNIKKNRYSDILPFDKNRVVLRFDLFLSLESTNTLAIIPNQTISMLPI